jgi:hypothetical protein
LQNTGLCELLELARRARGCAVAHIICRAHSVVVQRVVVHIITVSELRRVALTVGFEVRHTVINSKVRAKAILSILSVGSISHEVINAINLIGYYNVIHIETLVWLIGTKWIWCATAASA